MMQINQINFILFDFFTVTERRRDKLYLDNTELAAFAKNPSIFVWKKKNARNECQSWNLTKFWNILPF